MATDITAITNQTSATDGATALAGIKTAVTSIDTNKAELVSPSFTTPSLGVASATSINKVAITQPASGATITIADGKTATINKTLTLDGTDGTTMTFPSTSATIARTDAANTFTGVQTMTSPSVSTSIDTASTSFTALAGATTLLTIGGTGASASMFAPSTLDSTSSTTGAIRTSGGISAAKAANIGTTINAGTGYRVNGAAGSGKILKGDGTNFVASTETYAAPGTSGNVMTSDGTNWTSAASTGGGGEWTYVSKVTYSNETGTKTFSSLSGHAFYKLVFNLGNTTANALTVSFTINNITAASTYNYFSITNTTLNQTSTTNFYLTQNSSEQATLIGSAIIQAVHNNGTKSIIPSVTAGNTVSDTVAILSGQMTGNSADVSSIEIISANAVTGTVELWTKDNK